MQAPQRRHKQSDSTIHQALAQQVGGQDAANMHQRDDHARRVIVDGANQRLHVGELQRQKLRVVAYRVWNVALVKVKASLKAIYPKRIVRCEGPVGSVDPAYAITAIAISAMISFSSDANVRRPRLPLWNAPPVFAGRT